MLNKLNKLIKSILFDINKNWQIYKCEMSGQKEIYPSQIMTRYDKNGKATLINATYGPIAEPWTAEAEI